MVSAKLGMPFEASSNKAFGLKMTEVFRSKLTKASAVKSQQGFGSWRGTSTNP